MRHRFLVSNRFIYFKKKKIPFSSGWPHMNILKITLNRLWFDKLRLSIHKTKINPQNFCVNRETLPRFKFCWINLVFNSTRNQFEVSFSKVVKGFVHSIYKIILFACVSLCRRVIKLLFSISISRFPVNP